MSQIDKTKKYRSAESLSWKEYIHDNWKRDLPLLLMLLIPTLYFIIFAYGPMFGLLICFQDFKIGSPFLGEGVKWVGFKWFIDFFNNAFFGRIIRNTLLISLYDLIFVFPLPIIVAIIFNEIRNVQLKGFVQTVSYMPYFLSTPVVVGMMVNFLAPSDGIINQFIVKLGGTAIDFMQEASWFRTLYTVSDAWASVGFSSIVFIAAIAGISPSLYEAAYVDGSTRFKNIIHITLPSIAPTIVIMLLLRLGSLLSVGYEKIILMYNSLTYETADVISTYSYRNSFGGGSPRFSYSAAIGFFNSVVNVIVLFISNAVSRKINETSLW